MSDDKKKELNEKELDDVSGGGWWSSNRSYKSGSEPVFTVGEHVVVREVNLTNSTYRHAVILEVQSKSFNVYSEFRYKVQYDDDGSTESDVFESQMLYESGHHYYKRTGANE